MAFGAWLRGYVLVEVKGKNPERLLNLCHAAGFPVWGIRASNGNLLFHTSLSKYKGIHRLARRSKCVPRVRARIGLPFLLSRAKRRPVFLLVAAIMLAFMVYLAGSVMSIKVSGGDSVSSQKILASAARAGLRVGSRKGDISSHAVEAAILEDHPELSWVYAHFKGTLAVIEVVKKTRPDADGPGDLVASKDGLVTSILVLSGTPTVEPGRTVKAGDILVKGTPGDPKGSARGKVVATTWYRVLWEVPLLQSVPRRTGRSVEVTVIRYAGNEFVLGRSPSFLWYEVEDYTKATIPGKAEVVGRVFYEVIWVERELEEQEAREMAEREAMAALTRELPSSAKLIDLSYETRVIGPGIMAVRLTASAEEDIGVLRPWPKAQVGGR